MLQLGEFDLELALGAAGPLPEYIEDQFGAIEYSDLPQALKVALLDGRDFMIEKNQLGTVSSKKRSNLVSLAGADVKLRIGSRTMADQAGCHGMTGRLGQCAKLIKGRIVSTLSTQRNADQQCTGNRGL